MAGISGARSVYHLLLTIVAALVLIRLLPLALRMGFVFGMLAGRLGVVLLVLGAILVTGWKLKKRKLLALEERRRRKQSQLQPG